MLDIKFIRENPKIVKEGAEKKGAKIDIDELLQIDEKRRALQAQIDEIRAEKNQLSKEINQLSPEERDARIAALKAGDAKADALEEEHKKTEEQLTSLLMQIPNLPDDDVPVGPDDSANKTLKQVGEKPKFNFTPADYLDLAQEMGIIDTETASKISGSRFGYLKGAAAMLEFALVQYTFAVLTDKNKLSEIAENSGIDVPNTPFVPVVPPVMLREEPYVKMARLTELDKEERYYIPSDELYLAGSAEHTLGPMHMDEIFADSELPLRYLGFSTSFRREAGSYGKDTRGILRVHQFDKLEMETFADPKNARKEFDFVVAIQEYLVSSLGLPYQLVFNSTGDMGAPDARQHDIEIWLPSENKYRETHTADYNTDYQSRRLNTRVRRPDGNLEFVHMIDATAFAIGRTLISILENYQQEDGSIAVPEALKPYVPFEKIEGPYGMG